MKKIVAWAVVNKDGHKMLSQSYEFAKRLKDEMDYCNHLRPGEHRQVFKIVKLVEAPAKKGRRKS